MPGRQYSDVEKAGMVGMASNASYRAVAAHFGCSVSTVGRIIKKHKETGTTSSPKRQGHSPFTNPRMLSRIKRIVKQHRSATWQQLIVILRLADIHIGRTTIKKVVRDRLGLHRRKAISKPFLNRRARKLRLEYAISHREDTVSDWRRTIFVDEAMVKVDGNGVVWVTRGQGEAYLEECMLRRKSLMGDRS
jgi:transposase